jgi:putative hydrolase of the HAD superfamily
MKAVFFDAADTLFYLPKSVGWHYAHVAEKHGGYLAHEVIDRRFKTIWRAMPPASETSGPRPDDDRDWWKSMVCRVFSDAPPSFNIGAFFDEIWEEFTRPGIWELFPETLKTLDALHGKFRLGIVSNFDTRLFQILPQLGISHYFEKVIVSSQAGADKPSPRIFDVACKTFSLQPRDILFVGDDPVADWQGAANAGMAIYELKRPSNDLSGILQIVSISSE